MHSATTEASQAPSSMAMSDRGHNLLAGFTALVLPCSSLVLRRLPVRAS